MPCPRTHEQWGEWRWWFLYNSPPAMEEWEGDKFSTRNGPQTPKETIQKKSGDDFPEEWGDITIWSTQTHRWVGTSLGSETIRCVTLYDFSLGYWVVGQVIWPGYHLYSFSSTFLYHYKLVDCSKYCLELCIPWEIWICGYFSAVETWNKKFKFNLRFLT